MRSSGQMRSPCEGPATAVAICSDSVFAKRPLGSWSAFYPRKSATGSGLAPKAGLVLFVLAWALDWHCVIISGFNHACASTPHPCSTMEADLARPPSPSRVTGDDNNGPTSKQQKRRSTYTEQDAARAQARRREWDEHARDLTWNWIDEKDMEVFAKVSIADSCSA